MVVLFAIAAQCLWAAEPKEPEAPNDKAVELTGRVSPLAGSTNLQFKVQGGPIYRLKHTREGHALFADTNLHSRILVLKGRVQPGEKTFAVTGNLHSIRSGKLHELYYYCDVCAIVTSYPGPCMCCREPVVLTEEPK